MDQVLFGYQSIVKEISDFRWEDLGEADMTATARAYYYFSVQFRENLQLACQMYPADPLLAQLLKEECDTANLSPWPGVAAAGERMDHDEFMRRLLDLPGSTSGVAQCRGRRRRTAVSCGGEGPRRGHPSRKYWHI